MQPASDQILTSARWGPRLVILCLRWLAAGFVLWLICGRIQIDRVFYIAREIGWLWAPAALMAEAARILSGGGVTRRILRSLGCRCLYPEVVRINVQAAFFGVVSDWLGAVARWGGMASRFRIPSTTVLLVILIEMFLTWTVACGINWILFAYAGSVWKTPDETRLYFFGIFGFSVFLTIVYGVVTWVRRTSLLDRFRLDVLKRARLLDWFPAVGWILVQFICSAGALSILSSAAGFEMTFGTALWICALANLIQSFPGILFGWSLRIGILVFLMPRIGGTAEQGAVIGVLSSLVSFTAVLAGALDFLLFSRSRRPTAEALAV